MVIVPSRGRPHNVAELIKVFAVTRTTARLHVAVDEDDPRLVDYSALLDNAPGWVSWTAQPRLRIGPLLNERSEVFAAVERVIGFMGDDHRPRTNAWDHEVLDAMRRLPGIVYCDDLLQSGNLPTAVFMDSRIIRALGYMVPTTLQHLYLDNYWRDLGHEAGCLTYLGGVVIEHMHPVAGKAEWDTTYVEGNDATQWQHDGPAYDEIVRTGVIQRDAEIVRKALT